ncbi:MAG: type III pantothenate kinase [Lentisphaeraceae bacterium]|nr:type III pantothenate kinase [Lentisphaeraceae bacterium]
MSTLLINIGNTNSQVSSADLSTLSVVPTLELHSYLVDRVTSLSKLYIASVHRKASNQLKSLNCTVEFLTHKHLSVDFSKVKPETIGADRLANIAAVPVAQKNTLVIDCGTCVTGELVSEASVFEGGFIMPGRALSRQALNSFTSQLPIVDLSTSYQLLGTTTEESIQVGVDSMSALALQSYIDRLKQTFSTLNIILTGGDSAYYAESIEPEVSIDQELTLKGLRSVFIDKS